MIAVGITTFNRAPIVPRAIRSALDFVEPLKGSVIVVDDASSDDTRPVIESLFARELSDGRLTMLTHPANAGVTAAKNSAFAAAEADWVLFLDSDDELIAEAAPAAAQVLERHTAAPVVFFRCLDDHGRFVGHKFSSEQVMTLERFTRHTSYGEALLAMNKRMSMELPFDADLRGYEGLGCARLIARFGPGILSTVVVRRYDRSKSDRLSRPLGLLSRAHLLARGHFRYAAMTDDRIDWQARFRLRIKAVVYSAAGAAFAVVTRCLSFFRSRS